MKIARCGIHGFHETLGIDAEELRFFWTLESEDEDAKQTAYRVTVWEAGPSGKDPLSHGAVVWSSGRQDSSQQRDVSCKPVEVLRSTCSYSWKVTVWDHQNQEWDSADNSFFTAYPRSQSLPPLSPNPTYMPHTALIFRPWFEDIENKWKAWWIGDGGDKPIYLRRSFKLDRQPCRVIAFVSGMGHFNFTANGKATSDHVLDPGWTNYHRTVQYVAHDLTQQIQVGDNVVGAHVGNGFYAGDQGDRFFWPKYEDNTYVRYGNELCFFAELHFFYEDGTHDVIISDNSWRVRKSVTTLANIYASETHDRRLYPIGWDTPNYDDSSWVAAKGLMGPRGLLKYQSQPPIIKHETFEAIKTTSPRPGTVCYDLGQNASTMVKVIVEGASGSEVTIRYGETAYEDGTIKMPDPLFKQFETHVYSTFILAGTGAPEEWEPNFSFTSARYIQVDGVALEADQGYPVIHSAVGQHVSTAARRLGEMKTDKEDVNALLTCLKWTFASNLFSYHTDCPQIEKFGWLEVTHMLAPATQYMVDMESLYTKIIDDILDAQDPSGLVPTMAPEIRYMAGPLRDTITWGCALLFLPDILRKCYGSTHTIPRVYRAAERYMQYMKKKERKGGLIEHGLGDWGRDIAHGHAQANIETAVYHECLKCMERFAIHLHLPTEAAHWASEASRIFSIYNTHLLITNDPSHPTPYYTTLDDPNTTDRDTIPQAIALQFSMVPPVHISSITSTFLTLATTTPFASGEIGLRHLFKTLHDVNRPDIVMNMVRKEEHPSYMRFLRKGETTLNEFWQDECRSKCHDMLGSVLEWFYIAVLGLEVDVDGVGGEGGVGDESGEGWKKWILKPCYESEFGMVQGTFDCPYGGIEVKFERKEEEGRFEVFVVVPMGTSATVILPGENARAEVKREASEMRSVEGEKIVLSNGRYVLDIVS